MGPCHCLEAHFYSHLYEHNHLESTAENKLRSLTAVTEEMPLKDMNYFSVTYVNVHEINSLPISLNPLVFGLE